MPWYWWALLLIGFGLMLAGFIWLLITERNEEEYSASVYRARLALGMFIGLSGAVAVLVAFAWLTTGELRFLLGACTLLAFFGVVVAAKETVQYRKELRQAA